MFKYRQPQKFIPQKRKNFAVQFLSQTLSSLKVVFPYGAAKMQKS